MKTKLSIFVGAVMALFIVITGADAASKRIVEWRGEVVKLSGAPGRSLQVTMPTTVQEVIKGSETIDVQVREKTVVIKMLSHDGIDPQLYVATVGGVIPVMITTGGEPDMVVEVVDTKARVEAKAHEDQQASAETDPASLIVAMAKRANIAGFSITDSGKALERFSKNGMVEAKLLKIYQSTHMTGYIVEVKNKSVLPLMLSESDFVAPNVVAVAMDRDSGVLAPNPKTAEQVMAGQHRMCIYIASLPGVTQ